MFFSDWWLKTPPPRKKCHPFQKVKLFRYSLATKGSEKSLNQLLDETSNIFCVYTFTLEMMIQEEAFCGRSRPKLCCEGEHLNVPVLLTYIYIYIYTDSLCETLAAKKCEAVPDSGGRNKGCFLVSDLNLSA